MHSGNRPGTVWELCFHTVCLRPGGQCLGHAGIVPLQSSLRSAQPSLQRRQPAESFLASTQKCDVPTKLLEAACSLHLQRVQGISMDQVKFGMLQVVQHRFIDYRSTGSSLLPALSSHPAFPAPKALNPKDSPESTGGACLNTAHVRHFLNVKTVRIPSDEFKEPKKAEL